MKRKMATVRDVAEFLLHLANVSEGDLVSNKKLQQMTYYCQGFSLAVMGKPLFENEITARQSGPVCRELFAMYEKYGTTAIPFMPYYDTAPLSAEQKNLIREVYGTYGQFVSWRLSEMSMNEPPYKSVAISDPISHQSMRDYFITQIA